MSELIDILAALLLLIGAAFTLIGSIGLVRLPDFYTRMHAPTKATTLGVSSILAAAAMTLPGNGIENVLKSSVIIVLLFLTAPIGAHMLARAARGAGIPPAPQTHVNELPPAPREHAGEEPPPR